MTFFFIILSALSIFAVYYFIRTKEDLTLDWIDAASLFSIIATPFAMDAYTSYTG